MDPVSYDTTMAISQSWDAVKKDDDWEVNFGSKIIKKGYELDPLCLKLFFSFSAKGCDMYASDEFKRSARECSNTLDFVVTSIGPDMDVLFGQLIDMVTSSDLFGRLRPEHWNVFRESLLFSLKDTLGDRFDDKARASWEKVFDSISAAMKKFLRPSRRASTQ